MKSLLIKTAFVIVFLLVLFKTWATDVNTMSVGITGEPDLPWYRESWAWIIPVVGFVLIGVALIKTGEKKAGQNHKNEDI